MNAIGIVDKSIAHYVTLLGESSASAPETVTIGNCAKCTAAVDGITIEPDDIIHSVGDVTGHGAITSVNLSDSTNGVISAEHTVKAIVVITVEKRLYFVFVAWWVYFRYPERICTR